MFHLTRDRDLQQTDVCQSQTDQDQYCSSLLIVKRNIEPPIYFVDGYLAKAANYSRMKWFWQEGQVSMKIRALWRSLYSLNTEALTVFCKDHWSLILHSYQP
jgi:hypothetical protein